MKFALEHYASVGRQAALAGIRKDTQEAQLCLQWCLHALKTEHDIDRILGRAAYDQAHRRVMLMHREFHATRKQVRKTA